MAEYDKAPCFDPAQLVWPGALPEDNYDPAAQATTLSHRSFRPFIGLFVGFHAPNQYGMSWAKIRPSVRWNVPGTVEEPRLDSEGQPVLGADGRPILDRYVYAVPKSMVDPLTLSSLRKGATVLVSPFPESSFTFYAVALGAQVPLPHSEFSVLSSVGVVAGCGSLSLTPLHDQKYSLSASSPTYPYYFAPNDIYSAVIFLKGQTPFLDDANPFVGLIKRTTFVVEMSGNDGQESFIRVVLLDWDVGQRVESEDLAPLASRLFGPSWTSARTVLTPFCQFETLAGPGRTLIKHWSFDRTEELPEHRNAQDFPVSFLRFPEPISPFDGLNVRVSLEVLRAYSKIGLWGVGSPYSLSELSGYIRLPTDLAHRYPAPYLNSDGYLEGLLIGVPPGIRDEPFFWLHTDLNFGQELPEAVPAVDPQPSSSSGDP